MTTFNRSSTVSILMRMMLIAAQICAVFGVSVLGRGALPALAAGQVTGVVFRDFNSNGLRDTGEIGLAGVTVTGYSVLTSTVGGATTDASGLYTLTVAGATTQVRVEFTDLPAGYESGPHGSDSGTTVQFVDTSSGSATANLGVNNPSDYCQSNPEITTNCYKFGDQIAGPNSALPVLQSFPYDSGTTSLVSNAGVDVPTTHTMSLPASAVGTTWGLAYHRQSRSLFASAFTKRHAGFGPGGTGAIYRVDPVANTASVFLNLNAPSYFPGSTGTDPHTPGDSPPGFPPYFNDEGAFDAVGKIGIGDIDISDDGAMLWAVALADRRLYRIPIGVPPVAPPAASITPYALPDPGTGATGCPRDPETPDGALNFNVRPFGLKATGNSVSGTIYVGMVCTAQSTQITSQLRAFVYAFNPATVAFTQVANFALDYPRLCVSNDGSLCAPGAWRPWKWAPPGIFYPPFTHYYYPQPMLTDIELDESGFMIIGLRDRFGDQSGNDNGIAPAGNAEGVSGGDALRLEPVPGGFQIENNGTSGGITTGGANNGDGPGGGQYYYQDDYAVNTGANALHANITLGGLALQPGKGEIVSSAFNPPPTYDPINGQPSYRTGGAVYLSNLAGTRTRSYMLYSADQLGTFGKAAGIGDVELMCDLAPIEIGNRVWNDSNSNGIQDPGEAPFGGVVVTLTASNNTIITATTDASGNYYFSSAAGVPVPGASSVVGLNGANPALPNLQPNNPFTLSVPTSVGGLALTLQDASSGPNSDIRDSDANPATGIATLTTGGPGANNHTYDFGYAPPQQFISVGNQVWFDTNNNGMIDAGEAGVPGVQVQLYRDTNGDCVFSAGDTQLGVMTTGAGGFYTFTNLLPNIPYIVVLPAINFDAGGVLNKYQNSSTSVGCGVADQDNKNHGFVSGTLGAGGVVASRAITPTATNLSYDFGFYTLSLGDLVWEDLNNNGQFDGSETGVAGVTVRLNNCDGTTLDTTTTNASGIYGFTGLVSGTYCAEIVVPASYVPSRQIASSANPDNNVNNDQNGVNAGPGNTLGSNLITLTPGYAGALGNNTVNPANGSTYNPTLDFGIWRPAAPALQILKLSNPLNGTIVEFGARITYTLLVTNVGGSPATNVIVTDSVPLGSDYVTGSAVPPPVSGPNPLVWHLGTLNAGQAATIVFVVRVQSNPSGVNAITNTATAGCPQCGVIESNRIVNPFRTTAITLLGFSATFDANSGVKIAWATGMEQNTWGFFIWRSSTNRREDGLKVNTEPVFALGSNGGGASYSLIDKSGSVSTNYWLQEVEFNGVENWYGPTKVQASTGGGQVVGQQQTGVVIPAGAVPGGVPIANANTNANTTANVNATAGNPLPQPAPSTSSNTNSSANAPLPQMVSAKPIEQSKAAAVAAPQSASQPATQAEPAAAPVNEASVDVRASMTGASEQPAVQTESSSESTLRLPSGQVEAATQQPNVSTAETAEQTPPRGAVVGASDGVKVVRGSNNLSANVRPAAASNATSTSSETNDAAQSGSTRLLLIVGLGVLALTATAAGAGAIAARRRRARSE